jgi:Na+/serine symporter
MTPGRVNFLCPQGSTFSRRLTYKIDDIPVNLTGYSSRLQVRETHYDADTIVSLTSGSGITLGGSAGTIDILIAASATALFDAGTWVYDLEIQSTNGTIDRLVEGSFIVTPEVTR